MRVRLNALPSLVCVLTDQFLAYCLLDFGLWRHRPRGRGRGHRPRDKQKFGKFLLFNQVYYLVTMFPHKDEMFKVIRNSRMFLNEIYFWTNTIKDWKPLLSQDKYKLQLIESLKELVKRGKIVVYAFVIMPNHVHIIWKMAAMNGKEMPHASFNKFTAHKITEDLRLHHPAVLHLFKVEEKERKYRIWQRDALAILMDTRKKVEQKLDYIHYNPLQEHWKLSKFAEDYFWSSARFYETGVDDFGFLTHYIDEF